MMSLIIYHHTLESLIMYKKKKKKTLSLFFPTTERKCSEPCRKGWLYFKSSCYQFIYNAWPDWNSWEKSQSDCVEKKAHLVIIDTAEEQVRQERNLLKRKDSTVLLHHTIVAIFNIIFTCMYSIYIMQILIFKSILMQCRQVLHLHFCRAFL